MGLIMPSNNVRRVPQTTVLVVEKEYVAEAAVMCSLLGDEHKTRAPYSIPSSVVRVVTVEPSQFATDGSHKSYIPTLWRCHANNRHTDRWTTFLGTPDGVFSWEKLEQAIVGKDTLDDGGAADFIVLCGKSIAMLHYVAEILTRISEQKYLETAKTLIISSVGAFRNLDMFARRVPFRCRNLQIAFCGFACPLWYCRIVRTGVVLLVKRSSHGNPKLLVRPSHAQRLCRQVWNPVLQQMQQIPKPPPLDTFRLTMVSSGVELLFYQLQDVSTILFPCIFASTHWGYKSVGKLALTIVIEIYKLHTYLLALPGWKDLVSHDTLLVDLVGSNLWVEFTNNSAVEILERMKRNEAPFRNIRFLEFLITRQTECEWKLATSASPFESMDQDPLPRDANTSYVEEALSALVLILGVGQVVGMQVDDELSTILTVVRQLQSSTGKSYVVYQGGLVWNTNQLVDTLTPKAFGISTLDEFLQFLSKNPNDTAISRFFPPLESRL
jgi:hypothetical protein